MTPTKDYLNNVKLVFVTHFHKYLKNPKMDSSLAAAHAAEDTFRYIWQTFPEDFDSGEFLCLLDECLDSEKIEELRLHMALISFFSVYGAEYLKILKSIENSSVNS